MGKRLVSLLSDTPKGPKGQGGLALNEPRAILNGILWILRTGASCEDLPERYPPCQICHRWFQRWRKEGASDAVLPALADDLRERGRLDLRETFIDGTFAPEKKGLCRWYNQARQGRQDQGGGGRRRFSSRPSRDKRVAS